MFTNYLLDAVADIGHAMIFQWVMVVIIIPIITLIINIYKIIKENYIIPNKSEIKVNYTAATSNQNSNQHDINLLKSSADKIREGYGLISLSKEELNVLKKHGIIK